MPRGLNPYDEANLQNRLWAAANLNTSRHTFWMEAAIPQCVSVESSGKVSSIQDAFGRTGSFVQATDARRPTFTPSVASDPHSLKFSNSGQNNLDSSDVTFSGANQSVFVVLRSANPSINGEDIYDTGADNALSRRRLSITNTTGRLTAVRDGSGGSMISPITTIFGWQAVAVVYNGSTSFIAVNGLQTTGTISTSTTSSVAPYRLGSRFATPSTSNWFNGNLAALVHFNGVWTANEVALLQGYFAWRGGFNALLTASHPYRNRPPLIGD
jgi:hypothetical protein